MRAGAGGMTRGGIIVLDITAPSLSNASDGTPTADGADDPSVDTNEGNGTLYWAVLTDGGSCTDAQLKAGSGGNIVAGKAGNQVVSGTGTQTTPDITGLSSSTNYEIVFLHRDASGNDSSQASVGLTTAAGGGDGTITFVQGNGTSTPNAASGSRAFTSNVTAGNKIVICAFRFAGTDNDDPFVAGDCAKSAGTATIGAVALGAEENIAYTGTSFINAGVWVADVTGTGSLTMTVTGTAGNYWGVVAIEINSDSGWDGTYLEDTIINATASDNTSCTSGDATSAGKAIFIGVVNANSGSAIAITPDVAFTTIFEQEDGTTQQTGSVIYKIVSAGNTDSFDWTLGNNDGWVCAGVVIKGVTA